MHPTRFLKTSLASLILGLSLSAHANLSPEQLAQQRAVIDRALNDSSVTDAIDTATHSAATDWLNRAQRNLESGNLQTARSQLLEAGRLLYPMEPRRNIGLSQDKQRAWLGEIDRVMTTLTPVAREIAEEKGASSVPLDRAVTLQQTAAKALANAQLAEAEQLYTQAYNALQQEIVALRTGDEFVITSPSADSRAGWEDAQRRFADWRFFADWMEQVAVAMNTDAQVIRSGSAAADALYREAQTLAQAANWGEATRIMDSAYQVMEQHWRQAGVDI